MILAVIQVRVRVKPLLGTGREDGWRQFRAASPSALGSVVGGFLAPEAAPDNRVLINALDESRDREMLLEREDTHHCPQVSSLP